MYFYITSLCQPFPLPPISFLFCVATLIPACPHRPLQIAKLASAFDPDRAPPIPFGHVVALSYQASATSPTAISLRVVYHIQPPLLRIAASVTRVSSACWGCVRVELC